MLDYYDRVIVGIAGSILGGALLGVATALGVTTGLFVGALVATLLVYDVVFRNPPLPATDSRVAASVIVWHAALFVAAVAAYVR
nr:hypothetical protein [Natrinema salaciae]